MLFGRALTNAYRWYAPDVFSQPLYTPEELGAVVDAEWSYTSEEGTETVTEAAVETPALAQQETVTLQSLVTEYSAEKIMAANKNKIPSTDEDLLRVAEVLRGESETGDG
jgi:hypothetical protein